jgi:hypothetical protein
MEARVFFFAEFDSHSKFSQKLKYFRENGENTVMLIDRRLGGKLRIF